MPKRSQNALGAVRVRRFSRLLAAAWLCLRMVVVSLAFQASGAAHLVAHVLEIESGEEESDDDCQCPPGCPTCHGCSHIQVAIAASRDLDLAPAEAVTVRRDVASLRAPSSTDRDALYRPPRA